MSCLCQIHFKKILAIPSTAEVNDLNPYKLRENVICNFLPPTPLIISSVVDL